MALGLLDKYTIGIDVVFILLCLISTAVVKTIHKIASKRQWSRCTLLFERVILPTHFFFCLCSLAATLVVPSALGFINSWISIVGSWAILTLGCLIWNRQPKQENYCSRSLNVFDDETMVPLTLITHHDFQEHYLTLRGHMHKTTSCSHKLSNSSSPFDVDLLTISNISCLAR